MRKLVSPRLARRQALGGLTALGAGLVACGSDRSNGPATPGGLACGVTPPQIEGPFFVASPQRRDIRAGRPGTPLELDARVLDARTCEPLAGVVVELWHADAGGVYSAFGVGQGNLEDATGQDFLRGFQQSDADGRVAFLTVYPGWYPGRTPHLHLKASRDGVELLTTQLYFPEEVTDAVYAAPPYAARGPRDTTNSTDGVSRLGSGLAALLIETSVIDGGFAGEFELGLQV